MNDIASKIESYTEGRVKVEQYFSGELVPSGELFDSAGKDVIQMVYCTPAYLAGKLPGLADVESGIPLAWRSALELFDGFWNYGLLELCTEEYAKQDVHYYTPLYATHVGLFSKVPIYTLDDLKGLKIRSVGAQSRLLEKMGGSVTYLPGP